MAGMKLYRGNVSVLSLERLRNPLTGELYTGTLPTLELQEVDGTNIWGPENMPEDEEEAGTFRVSVPAAAIEDVDKTRIYGVFAVTDRARWRVPLPIMNRVR